MLEVCAAINVVVKKATKRNVFSVTLSGMKSDSVYFRKETPQSLHSYNSSSMGRYGLRDGTVPEDVLTVVSETIASKK